MNIYINLIDHYKNFDEKQYFRGEMFLFKINVSRPNFRKFMPRFRKFNRIEIYILYINNS